EAILPTRIDLLDISNPGPVLIEDFYTRTHKSVDFAGKRDIQILTKTEQTGHSVLSSWWLAHTTGHMMGFSFTAMTASRQCSVPEDRLYGILGLLPHIKHLNLPITYRPHLPDTERVEQAWADIVRKLAEGGDVQPLTYCGPPSTLPNSSWFCASPQYAMSGLPWRCTPGSLKVLPDGALLIPNTLTAPISTLTSLTLPRSLDPLSIRHGTASVLQTLHTAPGWYRRQITTQLFGGENQDGILSAIHTCLHLFTSSATTDAVATALLHTPHGPAASGRLYARAP
ncbi:hypothetical protein HK104_005815, partial [Borealophlyctis nickersoniae]